ncbi:hydroxyglutarate oxidase [Helicobacter sp. 12S02232-10]|uniref:L-2-hydroxyglutarate oxidase n=1 Tax=Helicobacter sp. 12S02232-10 TaxID=1476197 RepID=UPI000BA57FD0|nr:L-2-hydroxyglutarate oxidase [Helicobacter sp. 12S02232-10]PAF49522.1 hydroxyglutarate oxidase [Helicobacter sp. 12S02232-10]
MYDFIIVGGGIIGVSTAMQLLEKYPRLKVALLEKEDALARHQTGHNSGVIHAGVYYTPGSLKAQFCFEGNRLIKEFCTQNQIKFDVCGKILVATTELEMQRMKALWDRTQANGLERYWLDEKELKEKESKITGLGGIFFPASGITNYSEVAYAMAKIFQNNGGQIFYKSEVVQIAENSSGVTLHTRSEKFETKYMISCAGLYSDKIVSMIGAKRDFVICPFRGEYYQLADSCNDIVQHLIYPIPEPDVPFLGVHLTKMIDGYVTVGPNAVLAFKREGYKKTDINFKDLFEMLTHKGILKVIKKNFTTGVREMKNSFFKKGYLHLIQKYCPQLQTQDLFPYPAGVRAQAVSNEGELIEDFLFVCTQRTINVCNAPSPAATSSIPIGRYILKKAEEILKNND